MKGIGVWERGEGLCDMLREDLKQNGIGRPRLLRGRHPAELAGEELDLLVVSPRAVGWGGAMRVNCRLMLLPGSAAPMARGLRMEGAVSYGVGPKNTITLSSLNGETICLAVQRELVTVKGSVVERQELVLPYPPGLENPDLFMARVGALLLCGGMPNELSLQTDTGPVQTAG